MELKKHIPFIVIVLVILGTWNSTRLELAGLRIEFREEIRDLSKRVAGVDERVTALDARVTALDARVGSLSERVARIECVLSGKVSGSSQPQSSADAASLSAAAEIASNIS